MSDSVTIEQSFQVEFKIYSLACSECNADLDYEISADRHNDIYIEVKPCQCVKEAV